MKKSRNQAKEALFYALIQELIEEKSAWCRNYIWQIIQEELLLEAHDQMRDQIRDQMREELRLQLCQENSTQITTQLTTNGR